MKYQKTLRFREKNLGLHVVTRLFAIPTILLFWYSAIFAAETAHLIHPADKIIVTIPQVMIIGKSDGTTAGTKVQVKHGNEENFFDVSFNKTVFNRLITLKPGLNIIQLSAGTAPPIDTRQIFLADERNKQDAPQDFSMYYLHPKHEITADCSGCHQATIGELNYQYIEQELSCTTEKCHPQLGTAEFLHGPVDEGLCYDCHNPHGTENKKFLIARGSTLCYSCHTEEKEIFQKQYQHFPLAKGECLSCHDPHQSDLEFHLKRNSIKELCAGCHGRLVTSHPVMHEPAAAGDCITCHDPHASEFKNLLFESGNEMCFVCHSLRQDEFDRKFIHEPVSKDCGLCHDPHGSASNYHLRTPVDEKGRYLKTTQPLKDSCLLCHRKLDPELMEQIDNAPVKHEPVVQGKCTICHTPHSTNFKKQLKHSLAETCFPCHKKMKKHITRSKKKHGPVRSNDCSQCHLVHGAEHKNLLTAHFSSEFYGSFSADAYKLCFNCHNINVILQKQGMETGFRNGLSNLHFEHVNREDKGRNCITCHDVHAANQEKHIRSRIPYKKKFNISLKYTKTETGGGCVVGCHKPKDYDRENPVEYR